MRSAITLRIPCPRQKWICAADLADGTKGVAVGAAVHEMLVHRMLPACTNHRCEVVSEIDSARACALALHDYSARKFAGWNKLSNLQRWTSLQPSWAPADPSITCAIFSTQTARRDSGLGHLSWNDWIGFACGGIQCR